MKTALSKKLAEPIVRLFWRMQIHIFRSCPPLCGIVSKSTFNAYQNSKLYLKGLLPVAMQVPRAFARHLYDKRRKRTVLPRVSIIITARCTLKCDKCLGHCPDMKNQNDRDIDELITDIQALLSCVDYIYDVLITGGETFLHPNLDQIVWVCANSGKVGNISLITNGTIFPEAKVLSVLRKTKATVKISRYSITLQPSVEQLKASLEENDIHYIHEVGAHWVDTGEWGKLKDGSPTRRFRVCVLQLGYVCCWGTLHLCSESATLMLEKLIPDCKEDYINLRSTSPAAFHDELKRLHKRPALSACSYCLGQTYKTPKIPVAVQRNPGTKG